MSSSYPDHHSLPIKSKKPDHFLQRVCRYCSELQLKSPSKLVAAYGGVQWVSITDLVLCFDEFKAQLEKATTLKDAEVIYQQIYDLFTQR